MRTQAQVAPPQGWWTISETGTTTGITGTVLSGGEAFYYVGSSLDPNTGTFPACGSSGLQSNSLSDFEGFNVFSTGGLGTNPGGPVDCTVAGTYYYVWVSGSPYDEVVQYWELEYDGVSEAVAVNPSIVPQTNQLFEYSTRFREDCSELDGNTYYLCTDIVEEDLNESLAERWPTGIYVELSSVDFIGLPFARYFVELDESCDSLGCVGTSTTNVNIDGIVGTSSANMAIHATFWFYNHDTPQIRPFPRARADIEIVYDENGDVDGITTLTFVNTGTSTTLDARPFVECGFGSSSELFGCLQNFFVWLFWPSEITYDSTEQLRTSLQQEFPFSYVYGTFVGVASLTAPTSTPPDVDLRLWGGATSTLFSASSLAFLPEEQFTDLKTLMSVAMWFFLFFFFFVRYSKVF